MESEFIASNLPIGLTVTKGIVVTIHTPLPDNLTVHSYTCLHIAHAAMRNIPLSDFYISTSRGPQNLRIMRNAIFLDTDVTTLPDNMYVGGNLDITDTKITKLPRCLYVGGDLGIAGTKIKKIPDDAIIGGTIYACSTRVKTISGKHPSGANIITDGVASGSINRIVMIFNRIKWIFGC